MSGSVLAWASFLLPGKPSVAQADRGEKWANRAGTSAVFPSLSLSPSFFASFLFFTCCSFLVPFFLIYLLPSPKGRSRREVKERGKISRQTKHPVKKVYSKIQSIQFHEIQSHITQIKKQESRKERERDGCRIKIAISLV